LKTLASYVGGRWVEGQGDRAVLVNPATEEPLAEAGTGGIDMKAALGYARDTGGPALRALTFAQRGAMLKAAVDALQPHRNELLDLAIANGGNTRGDAKFDVDGGLFTLSAYADIGKALGETRILADGEGIALARNPRFHGQHVRRPARRSSRTASSRCWWRRRCSRRAR
jgi:oxepin-CoA hydrolase/3-oxo-5,6-dehydrosuberyl-CoA semialdehyde dehydrogenase